MKLKITRKITKQECPWIDSDLIPGDIIFVYSKHTYGCISGNGIAVSFIRDKEPFFEIPNDSFEVVK